MGKENNYLVRFFKNKRVLSELINDFVFGKEVIYPQYLVEKDTTIYTPDNRERIEDIAFLYKAVDGSKLVIHLEIQSNEDFRMLYRCMQYDTAEIYMQMEMHEKKENVLMRKNDSDFKSIKVLTLVVNATGDPWRSILSLLEEDNYPAFAKEYLNDYRYHLIDLYSLEDEQILRLDKDSAAILLTLKYHKRKSELKEIVMNYELFRSVDYDTAMLICDVFRLSPTLFEIRKGEKINMGEAWQELLQDKLNEGKIEGEAIGIEKGEAIGIEKSIISLIRFYLKRNFSRSSIAEMISEIFDGHEMTDAEYEKALVQ